MSGAAVHKMLPAAVAIMLLLALGGGVIWFGMPLLRAGGRQPALDTGQLRTLVTYKHRCRKQADCEAPLLCMDDARLGGWRCLASECESDLQCEPGFMCAPFHFPGSPPIQLCVVQGVRKEGEHCANFPVHEEHGCQPGLICNSGFCGRPCRPDGPPSCPDGFTCHPGNNDPACLPSCLRSGCPPDKQCVRMSGELAVCAVVHGHDREQQPCSPGEVCRRVYSPQWRSQAVNMWCALPCGGKEDDRCPQGSVCLEGYCERTCSEGIPGSCNPGEHCTRVLTPDQKLAVCKIDG